MEISICGETPPISAFLSLALFVENGIMQLVNQRLELGEVRVLKVEVDLEKFMELI